MHKIMMQTSAIWIIFPYFYNLPLRIRVDLFNNFAPVILEERSVEKFAKAHFFIEVTIARKLYC